MNRKREYTHVLNVVKDGESIKKSLVKTFMCDLMVEKLIYEIQHIQRENHE